MIQEKPARQRNGWPALGIIILLIICFLFIFVSSVALIDANVAAGIIGFAGGMFGFFISIFLLKGLFTLEPNQAIVLLLFGKYVGTEKTAGFRWCNPLYTRQRISLRTRNFDSDKLKVNDKQGNPIEISAVIVWKIADTARAVFEVDDYLEYVRVQSEAAVRHLATNYAYDAGDDETVSLRSSINEVSDALGSEIQERVEAAGVIILETRINHLAYAPEIAGAMLQRQQADAIISARQKIVEGAVGMVEMALRQLQAGGTLELDEERKANMVSNLMVVLCGERGTQPIVNAGSLY